MNKKFNKKGFTLVELLVTIVLLGVVATIIIYNMTSVSNQSKESDYKKFVAEIISAASVYADNNPEVFNDLYVNKAYLYITIKDLVTNGLYDADTINPYTEEKVGFDEIIKANLDSSSGQITFTYPLTSKEEETFLVAMSDYIAWGEPYSNDDCMYGAGTYQLALSTEAGDLIDLTDPAQVEKYHITCSLPDDFDSRKEGTYKITYSWLTESGTKKEAQRELRVMPQVVPTFKTNYDYTFDTWYTPKYNETTKEWETLKYTPYIEQASEETTFTITKKRLLPTAGEVESVTDGESKDFNMDYPVDDGSKEYTISAVIYGHHKKDYSYKASNTVVMSSKLIIPASFVSGGSSKWTTAKTFTIRTPYSPVGVDKYEYRLLADSDSVNDSSAVNNANTFTKSVDVETTSKNVSLSGSACTNSAITYTAVAFRAINEDGYVGDWVKITPANITNQMNLLMQTECANCASDGTCTSTGTGSCMYNNKAKYLEYGGKKFDIMEKFSDGSMIVAYDSTYGNVSPMSLFHGTKSIHTCDGIYTGNYTATVVSLQTIINAGQGFLNTLPSNYYNYLSYYTWPAGYSAYVGNIDNGMFSKYNGILSGGKYWTTSSTTETFVVVSHAGSVGTADNSYLYYVDGSSTTRGYAGLTLPIKPILKMRAVYACSGDGSYNTPYVIAS